MPTQSHPAEEALAAVRGRLAEAAHAAGRESSSVTLLAVSKGQTAERIAALAALGQRDFGENYVQEALPKLAALTELGLNWHFIGRLQANKTREVAAHFSWVHSVDRLRIAERLSAQRPAHLPPLQCLIELNADAESTKGGVDTAALTDLVAAVRVLPGLTLRGFMTMPAPREDPAAQRAAFRRVHEAVRPWMPPLDTLSMGTSGDFEAAIAEGSTLVRVGTAVFGPRQR
ncbi:MAG: YggS family pyridoxal phosphate-dependent enzyme [Gammaproteobacteria bacterium]|nr:YggS family pyridoxal phosphate-dependent enzyme [Gammaproteobacteria bacterium]